MAKERPYKMTVAGQLFKHLGLQMYSGAVPAISELVSNSYDAMARNVWITIPVGRKITPKDKIIIRDDGHGMNSEECNSLYLHVGRDRRSGGAEQTEPYNDLNPRKVHGRKGIGKLAGFGIAERIEVRTVKEKKISGFSLDYSELTKSKEIVASDDYYPKPLSENEDRTDEKNGCVITLSQLKITRQVEQEKFISSLARRFLILDDNFTVYVNEEVVSRQKIPFQFRFPEESQRQWEDETLDNGHQFRWWAGFCEKPIPDEEQRGFVVYVRGKLAQTPWFFDLSGGTWGQHGLQYLTGEIEADFLDEKIELITTNRGTVRWEDPIATPLKEWGLEKTRELLGMWVKRRRKTKLKSVKVLRYVKQSKGLPDRERKIFESAVNRICAIPQLDNDPDGKDITDDLVEFIYNALTNRHFLDVIQTLNAASPDERSKFSAVLSEWNIIEAVNTAHIVRGRVEIIRKFEQMIENKVREKPDMQEYVLENPWLIDPQWQMLEHEKQLDTFIAEKFGLEKSGTKDGAGRFDFFCLSDLHKTAYIVETKRPGKLVDREELERLRKYVLFLRERLGEAGEDYTIDTVKGLLIADADRIRKDDEKYLKEAKDAGTYDFRSWKHMLDSTKRLHGKFLEITIHRASADDPRIKSLSGGS